jgi:hypothetical protein
MWEEGDLEEEEGKGKRKRLNPTIQREEILWSHYQIKREEKESDLTRKIFVYSSILIGLH